MPQVIFCPFSSGSNRRRLQDHVPTDLRVVDSGAVLCEAREADGGQDYVHREDVFPRLEEPAEKAEGGETIGGREVEGKFTQFRRLCVHANLIRNF